MASVSFSDIPAIVQLSVFVFALSRKKDDAASGQQNLDDDD